ncbi:hypothetical protein Tco_1107890 [Tanacetum coccineum]
MELINLCFADDLFLFAHGDVNSARVIMDTLDEFKLASGLTPSPPKARLIFAMLFFRDCKELIEKVQNCVNDWKNKSLSAAGRLQLIRSMLSSMHIYWASMFILPSRVLNEIEQLMQGFLWCQGWLKKGRAKVFLISLLVLSATAMRFARREDRGKSVIAKHVASLLLHMLWAERNARLFTNKKRSAPQVIEAIVRSAPQNSSNSQSGARQDRTETDQWRTLIDRKDEDKTAQPNRLSRGPAADREARKRADGSKTPIT